MCSVVQYAMHVSYVAHVIHVVYAMCVVHEMDLTHVMHMKNVMCVVHLLRRRVKLLSTSGALTQVRSLFVVVSICAITAV